MGPGPSPLFLARADAESVPPELHRLDLAARAADLSCEGPDGAFLWARAHRPLLGRLLDNMLENARKYSEPGTPVVVRVGSESGAVALAVDDRGCGIPADDLPRVFELFYRGPSARLLGSAGTGLGLAVARRIAAAHGGTIDAESEPVPPPAGRRSPRPRSDGRMPDSGAPGADR